MIVDNETVTIESSNFTYTDDYECCLLNQDMFKTYVTGLMKTEVISGNKDMWKDEINGNRIDMVNDGRIEYKAQTNLGEKLLSLRKKMEDNGLTNLSPEEITTERDERRGGVDIKD